MLENPYYDEDFEYDDQTDGYYEEGSSYYEDDFSPPYDLYEPYRPDVGWLVGLCAFLLLLFVFARGGPTTTWAKADKASASVDQPSGALTDAGESETTPGEPDPYAFSAPYAEYVLTQGPHGQSYGHLAIDLAAGKGAAILSPINGTVIDNYTDQWGNPTLIIENDVYEVKMLHGIYSASIGEQVVRGQQVGVESNLGYTTDMRGVPCAGRTDYCGYHTHLNVFDKQAGQNVNPLSLMDR